MSFEKKVKKVLNKLPYIKGLHKQVSGVRHPNGHYYSSVFSIEDVKERQDQIWKDVDNKEIPGIDLNLDHQKKLVASFQEFYEDIPFAAEKQDNLRYYFKNMLYDYSEGIILYSMMRKFKPKNIIEIGSGYSSAVMLDTNDLFFDGKIKMTFIEPYTERLNSLLTSEDNNNVEVIEDIAQSISLDVFDRLEAGDILFIDSSHVSKTGSDVNYILFDILPRLKKGVLVHFHDIYNQFLYPKDKVFRGINWNETYIVRAFMMYNNGFDIVLYTNYLQKHYNEVFKDMPLLAEHPASNFWIQKK